MSEAVAQIGSRRAVPNITSTRPDETARFFADLLGFGVVMDAFQMITVAASENPSAQINIHRVESGPVTGAADHHHPALRPPHITVEVDDVDEVHRRATERGLDIRYPLTDEVWGVRRFFVSDPNGVVINVMSHLS